MLIHNAQVTGSLTLNGIDIGDITGSEASIGALNSFSASINVYTGSNNTNINALHAFSSSILTYTGSNDTLNNTQNSRLSALETTSGSLLTASGSFSTRVTNLETASGSFSTRVTSNESNISALQTASGSFSTRTTNLETASGSFSTRTTNLETASGSFSTRVTNAESSITSLNSKTGSYATTGSNIFNGTQTITGSLFVTQNLTVLGSSSISYVSQSTLNIGTNLITVNAQNPSVRFGGLAVIDSGSVPQVSGSWLFDSIQNRWIMIHQQTAGGAVTSSIALMGPETYNNLGNETQITQNRLVKGVAGASGEHIGDSNISDTGTVVSINSNTQITGSLNVGGASTFGSSASNGDVTIISNSSPFVIKGRAAFDRGFLGLSWDVNPDCGVVITNNLRLNTNATPGSNAGSTAMFISGSGNVGIGTTLPAYKLDVVASTTTDAIRVQQGGSSKVLLTGDGVVAWGSSANAGVLTWDTGFARVNAESTNDLRLTTSGGGMLIVKSGGSVGIGTTSPIARLSVRGSSTGTLTAVTWFSDSSVNQNGLAIRAGTGVIDLLASWEGTGIATNITFTPTTLAGGQTEAMRVASTGNIGIGTTSPSYRLTVKSAGTSTFALGVTNQNNNIIGGIYETSGNAGQLYLYTNTTETVKISSVDNSYFNGGNVGIGTTNPSQARLHVDGGIYYTSIIGSGGLGGRLWVPGQAIGQASNAGLYGLALTYLADYNSGWKSVGGGYASAITIDEGIFSFSNSQGVGAPNTALTWTTRLMVNESGNVGIGTTSPNSRLDVNGVIRVTDGIIGNSSNNLYLSSNSAAGEISFWGNQLATRLMTISGSGNVGIGTNTPATRLDIIDNRAKTSGVDEAIIRIRSTDQYGASIHMSGSSNWRIISTGVGSTPGGNDLGFYSDSGTSYRMVIQGSDGNVGIGTTAPVSLLNVHGSAPYFVLNDFSANDFGIKIRYLNSETHGLHLLYNANAATASINNTYPVTPGQVWGDIYFRQNVGGTMTTRMMIKADGGNVGIGTTSPAIKLSVVGGISLQSNNNLTWGNVDYGAGVPTISAVTSTGFYLYPNGSTSGATFRIQADGNVGIGTTSPTYTLDVAGNFRAQTSGIHVMASSGDTVPVRITTTTSNQNSRLGFATLSSPNSYNVSVGAFATSSLGFWTNDTVQGYITSGGAFIYTGGNVGIGTTTTTTRLTVSNGGANTSTNYQFRNISVTSGFLGGYTGTAIQSLLAGFDGSIYGTDIGYGYDGAGYTLMFSTNDDLSGNPIERMRITSTGNVGIGTTSPSYTLQVGRQTAGDNTDYAIAVSRHGTGVSPGTWTNNPAITIQDQTDGGPASVDINGLFNISLGRFDYTDTNAANATLLSFTYDGQLGPMRVDGRGNTWIGYNRASAPTNSGAFGLLVYGGISVGSSTQSTTPPSNGAIIQGNVGIGTTSPSNTLHVVGTIRWGGNGTTFSNYSDIDSGGMYIETVDNNTGRAKMRFQTRVNNSGGYTSFQIDANNSQHFWNIQDTLRLTLNSSGHLLPGANGTQNLGSSSLRWSTVFTSDLSLSNGIGDYTIVEGENDLFLYNNKQNKVYKFVVEEVDPSTATPKKS